MRKTNHGDCVNKIYHQGSPLKPGEAAATWVLLLHGRTVYLFHWESDGELHRLTPACECAIDHQDLEHIEPYLEAALATGKFHRLILAGNAEGLVTLHQRLGPMLQSRIASEVKMQEFSPADVASLKEALEGQLSDA